MSGLLFGVEPADPLSLAGAAVLLATIVLAACLLTARRAIAADPVEALREG